MLLELTFGFYANMLRHDDLIPLWIVTATRYRWDFEESADCQHFLEPIVDTSEVGFDGN